ncbi:MAG TPA: FHA domain-containing protein [Candidatus Baltobacteraceae bacterium]
MSTAATLRIGSLEITLALVLFGVCVSRFGMTPLRRTTSAQTLRVALQVQDAPGTAVPVRSVELALGDGLPAALVGRSSAAAVGLLDPEVSRRHAQLEYVRGVLYLTDLGSSNGTFLNGRRLRDEGIEVEVGDDIDVGNARLKVLEAVPQAWT